MQWATAILIGVLIVAGVLAFEAAHVQFAQSAYTVANSARFNASNIDYLSKTLASGTRNTWTVSLWVKRGALGSQQTLWSVGTTSDDRIYFNSSDQLSVDINGTSTVLTTSQVFRDPARWDNLVVAFDATQGTASNRLRLYLDGTEITAFGTDVRSTIAQNTAKTSTAVEHDIGRRLNGRTNYFDGYLADMYFVDGTQLTPSSFGATDGNGYWRPTSYSGSYGTNGFHLAFGTGSALGTDTSGNSNTFSIPNASSGTYSSTGTRSVFATVGSAPETLAFDAAGNLYVVNDVSDTISKVTPAGSVSTFATVGSSPSALVFDNSGNLYTANYDDHTVSKITPAGSVTTFASVGTQPTALVLDASGNFYTANFGAGTVSKITPAGTVTTFASVGSQPSALAFDKSGNLYVANRGDNTISKITPAGTVTTFATVGTSPIALAFDSAGNLYDSDYGDGTVSKITPSGTVTTFASVGAHPYYWSIAIDGADNLYVTSFGAAAISKVTPAGVVTTFATTGTSPMGITFDPAGNTLYYADEGDNTVSKVTGITNVTTSGLSVSDQMLDTPTDSFATGNPIAPAGGTYSNANLSNTGGATSTMFMSSGKWYWEVTATTSNVVAGVVIAAGASTTVSVSSGTTVGFFFDADAGTLNFTTDGSTYSSLATSLTGGRFVYATGGSNIFNFGQGGVSGLTFSSAAGGTFKYNPAGTYTGSPNTTFSGYLALSTANLATPTIAQPNLYFDAKIYAGTGATLSVSGLNLQPDLVWLKDRTAANNHGLFDSVRGAANALLANLTNAEVASSTSLTAFTTTGFSLGADGTFNTNTHNYILWLWKKSPTTDGVDIVTYTGDNTANRAISHNLGVAPDMVIVKKRSAAGDWFAWQSSMSSSSAYALLDTTAATSTTNSPWCTACAVGNWGASTFRVTNNATNNANVNTATYVAYLFKGIAGFSSFGTYYGNGNANGPFVYTGFHPRYIMIKRTDTAGDWSILDTARDTYNPGSATSTANTAGADGSNSALDFLVNGFKLRSALAAYNASGGQYIYASFADEPFYYSAQPAGSGSGTASAVPFLMGSEY